MKKYTSFLGSGWFIITLTIIYLLYQFLILIPLSIQFKEITNNLQILDLNFYAFHKSVLLDLELYGEEGRRAYLSLMWSDILYPIIYGLLLTALLAAFLPFVHPDKKLFQRLIKLPLLTVLIDFGENISFYLLIKKFDTSPEYLDRLAGILNTSKWILVVFTIGVVFYSIAMKLKMNYSIGKSK